MSDSFVTVVDSLNVPQRIDNETVTTDAGSVQRQRVTVGNFPAVPHLDKSTDSVSVVGTVTVTNPVAGGALDSTLTNNTLKVSDQRGLVERMLAKAPAAGFHLWLDVTSSDARSIFIAEAPDGSLASAPVFGGIRVQLDASGIPLGAVQTAGAFAWDKRAAAAWGA